MNTFIQSSLFAKMIAVLLIILAILLIYQAGVVMGYRRGVFSYYSNAQYYRDKADPGAVFSAFIKSGRDANPHGAIGEIVSADLPQILVKDPDFSEHVVMVSPTTTIRRIRSSAAPSDLQSGDKVIVIGRPGPDGRIFASFIRILAPSYEKLASSSEPAHN